MPFAKKVEKSTKEKIEDYVSKVKESNKEVEKIDFKRSWIVEFLWKKVS